MAAEGWRQRAGRNESDGDQFPTAPVNDLYMVVESDDYERRGRLVLALQDKLIGKPAGGVN